MLSINKAVEDMKWFIKYVFTHWKYSSLMISAINLFYSQFCFKDDKTILFHFVWYALYILSSSSNSLKLYDVYTEWSTLLMHYKLEVWGLKEVAI